MVSLTVHSVVILSHRYMYLDNDYINVKTFVFLAIIGPSEYYHTTQTSKFKNFLNGASTILNNVFKSSDIYNRSWLHVMAIEAA